MRLGRVPRLKLALSSPKRPETVIVGRGKSQDQQQPATGFSFSGRLRRQEEGSWAASYFWFRGSPRDRVHIPFPLSYKHIPHHHQDTCAQLLPSCHRTQGPTTLPRVTPLFSEGRCPNTPLSRIEGVCPSPREVARGASNSRHLHLGPRGNPSREPRGGRCYSVPREVAWWGSLSP